MPIFKIYCLLFMYVQGCVLPQSNIMKIMFLSPFISALKYQVHLFNSALMFCAGGNNVNTSGIDTAMSEDICQLGDILFYSVECSCKQVS